MFCLKYADDKYIDTGCQEINVSVAMHDIQQSNHQQTTPSISEPQHCDMTSVNIYANQSLQMQIMIDFRPISLRKEFITTYVTTTKNDQYALAFRTRCVGVVRLFAC